MFDKLCKALPEAGISKATEAFLLVLGSPKNSSAVRQDIRVQRALDRSLSTIMSSYKDRWNFSPYGESNVKVQPVSHEAFDALCSVRGVMNIDNTVSVVSIPPSLHSKERIYYLFVDTRKAMSADMALRKAMNLIAG